MHMTQGSSVYDIKRDTTWEGTFGRGKGTNFQVCPRTLASMSWPANPLQPITCHWIVVTVKGLDLQSCLLGAQGCEGVILLPSPALRFLLGPATSRLLAYERCPCHRRALRLFARSRYKEQTHSHTCTALVASCRVLC